MRKRLAIGTILRSDDTVAAGGTLSTFLQLGMALNALGFPPEHVDFIPLMGGGKDLARAEVLAAFHHHSPADDLLWVDFGNGIPNGRAGNYLELLLTSEREALWCPYIVRSEGKLSFACSLAGDMPPAHYVETDSLPSRFLPAPTGTDDALGDVRFMRLGGCGFGMTRIRRSLVTKLYDHYGKERGFLSSRTAFGELRCIDLFSSRLGIAPGDRERADKPTRLLPEDDSFWHWCRNLPDPVHPYAMIDWPSDHGMKLPGVGGYTTFENWILADAAKRAAGGTRRITLEA